jgi:Mce-associated membrane protein
VTSDDRATDVEQEDVQGEQTETPQGEQTETSQAEQAETSQAEQAETEATDAAEPVAGTSEPTEPVARPKRRTTRWIAPVAAAVVLIAAASAAGWLYFFQYRVDQQTDLAASHAALDAAKDRTVALLSYAPETLDQDFSTAKSGLTGDFLNYYTDFTEKVVAPAAKQKSVKTQATVAQAAISEMKPDSAVALLFVNQATTSQENPDGAFASSSIKVGLTKVDGAWLISSFDPV